MITGTPVAATLTTTQKGDPAIYVSVKSDVDGYIYGSTFGLSSDSARSLSKMVLEYLGYNPHTDHNYEKLISGDSVDTSKTIEFELKEIVSKDGKTYKNITFPSLSSFDGKPKNILTKESAATIIATNNLTQFFSGFSKNEEIPF